MNIALFLSARLILCSKYKFISSVTYILKQMLLIGAFYLGLKKAQVPLSPKNKNYNYIDRRININNE